MGKVCLALTLVAMVAAFASTQEVKTGLPVTLRKTPPLVEARQGAEPVTREGSSYPPFCTPHLCLYYAGDYDTNDSGSNALYNANDEGTSGEGQVWVGVKPTRDVTVTGATFVQVFNLGYVGVNPTPFAVQVGIKAGQAGKTICSTDGHATYSEYGNSGNLLTYSYTIKNLRKSCKLKKGVVYYVNVLPTSTDGYGYLWNVPAKPQNHHGWKNDSGDCYFNSPGQGYDYVTCDSFGSFSEFSIALTGK